MTNIKVKGGWTMDREIFSENARNLFDIAVNHRRSIITLIGDKLKGMRFKDNQAILARLESMFTEKEFMECPGPRIDDALTDAAASDWWYQHEKKYDEESYFTDETEIIDEDNND